MALSEPEASSGFQITFRVLRYFTNLSIGLPAYSCHHFFPQFLFTHKYSVQNPGWEALLLSEAAPTSVQNAEVTSFSGEGIGKAFLSAVLIFHFGAKSCCLYGVFSSSGNYGYLLFCILSQVSTKTMSKRAVLIVTGNRYKRTKTKSRGIVKYWQYGNVMILGQYVEWTQNK